jgi:FKBP-type peptidyl-prolyl cis-trans isomerase
VNTVATTRYSEKAFDPDVDHLPPSYIGNNAEGLLRVIEARSRSQVRGEFETSENHNARVERENGRPLLGSLKLDSILAFKIDQLDCRYDPDAGIMKCYVPTEGAWDEAQQLTPGRLALLLKANTGVHQYVGSNAFGATTLVKDKHVKSIKLGIVNSEDFDLRDKDEPVGGDNFYGDLTMTPDEARLLKKAAKALVIGVLDDPPATKGDLLTEATIQNPTGNFEEIRYLNLRISEIWIYSSETGKVFLKMLPKTASAATTPQESAAAPALTTKRERFSYALGMEIGSKVGANIKERSLEVDWNLVVQGLKDEATGRKTRLTGEEAKALENEVHADIKTEKEAFLAANKAKEGVVTLPSGLQYKILTSGAGPKPTSSDSVVCNYRGTLINGKEFDSTYKRGQPATFGVNQVIKGWTEALQLMPVGSKWQFFIPSNLAYGERGAGTEIGPNATLIFEVELLSIKEETEGEASYASEQAQG